MIEINKKYRLHHSYIWLGSLRIIFIVLVAVLSGAIPSIIEVTERIRTFSSIGQQDPMLIITLVILATILLTCAIVLLCRALSYRYIYYELNDDEIAFYSGILSKKRIHIPYSKIQSVDQKASLLQRIFGVCNISIDTAGGANNNATVIPYISKAAGNDLRQALYVRKSALVSNSTQAPPPQGAPVNIPHAPTPTTAPARSSFGKASHNTSDPSQGNVLDIGDEVWNQIDDLYGANAAFLEPPSYKIGLTNKELLFTGLSGNSGFIIAIFTFVCVLSQALSFIFGIFGDESDGFIESTANAFGIEILIALGIGMLIIGAIFVWVLSIVSSCIKYGGFNACRRGSRIEVERGLLQHQTDSIDISRIQSVVIKQSFIRRIIGYCELSLGKVDAADQTKSSHSEKQLSSGIVIHPFLKIDRIQEVLNGLVPEFSDIPNTDTKVAPRALRRALIRRGLWQGSGFWLAVFTLLFQLSMRTVAYFDIEFAPAIPFIDIGCIFLYIFAAILFAINIVSAVLWFRESAIGVNRKYTRVKNSGLSVEDMVIPREKIQFGQTTTNPLQKLASTTTINIRTAAGVGGTFTKLIDVDEQTGEAFLNWIQPGKSGLLLQTSIAQIPTNPNLG